jgi:hypothetical protein
MLPVLIDLNDVEVGVQMISCGRHDDGTDHVAPESMSTRRVVSGAVRLTVSGL